jgi:hypothetical protein
MFILTCVHKNHNYHIKADMMNQKKIMYEILWQKKHSASWQQLILFINLLVLITISHNCADQQLTIDLTNRS